MTRTLSILALLALAGCQSTPVIVAPPAPQRTYLRDVTPQELMRCQAEPSAAGVHTNRQVARYVLALKAAGGDCRQKLGAVGDLIRSER
jgi:hypothetical protein